MPSSTCAAQPANSRQTSTPTESKRPTSSNMAPPSHTAKRPNRNWPAKGKRCSGSARRSPAFCPATTTGSSRPSSTQKGSSNPSAARTELHGRQVLGARFQIPKGKESELLVQYGGTAETLRPSLTGTGCASHGLVLQGTPYPYTDAFQDARGAGPVRPLGQLRLRGLKSHPEHRVQDPDDGPTAPLQPRHDTPCGTEADPPRSARRRARRKYRLYGTVAPARLGACSTSRK